LRKREGDRLLNNPFKFVFMILSQYSSVISAVFRVVGFTPAQLNTIVKLVNLVHSYELIEIELCV
jgi:hypothetical protein